MSRQLPAAALAARRAELDAIASRRPLTSAEAQERANLDDRLYHRARRIPARIARLRAEIARLEAL